MIMKFNIIDNIMHTNNYVTKLKKSHLKMYLISTTNNFIHRPKLPVVVGGAVVDSMGHFEVSNQISV